MASGGALFSSVPHDVPSHMHTYECTAAQSITGLLGKTSPFMEQSLPATPVCCARLAVVWALLPSLAVIFVCLVNPNCQSRQGCFLCDTLTIHKLPKILNKNEQTLKCCSMMKSSHDYINSNSSAVLLHMDGLSRNRQITVLVSGGRRL